MLIHVVRPGDTVYTIARSYGLSPLRVMADNEVPADGALAVGQTLVLRYPARVHSVSPGESLPSIARRYGLTLRQLWRNNWPLGGRYSLQPGQQLVIAYEAPPRLGAIVANSYAYPFIDPALLDAVLPYLTHLAPFTYGITEDGALLPLNDEALLNAARPRGTRSVLHLSTLTEYGGFSSQRAEAILTNPARQSRLLAQLLGTIQAKGYSAVDVDFEYIPGQLGDAYTDFITRLRAAVAPRPTWVALAPKTWSGQRGLLYEAHNYAALGAAADAVLLMT